MNTKFGTLLKSHIKDNNLTITSLARLINVPFHYLSNAVNGKCRLCGYYIDLISDKLCLSKPQRNDLYYFNLTNRDNIKVDLRGLSDGKRLLISKLIHNIKKIEWVDDLVILNILNKHIDNGD